MTKRNYIEEIAAKRTRILEGAPRLRQVSERVSHLQDLTTFIEDSSNQDLSFRNEVAKYVCIGFVACIEGYFRLAFQDLIDHGSPFRENAAEFRELKIGVDHAAAMISRKVTFGEFISHLLPSNSVDDINKSASILLGSDFLKELRHTKTTIFNNEPESLHDSGMFDFLVADMTSLFEHRHIFVHELNSKVKVDSNELTMNGRAATIFIHTSEELIQRRLLENTSSRRK